MRKTITRAFTLIAGAALALNLSTGIASAEPPDTKSVAHENPSKAKFECSDSHHSNTGHGANNDEGYQSTCDPADFGGNGQEDSPGEHTGKPCAGCVGNADDKNPPGQVPDGGDANSGYECDGRDRPFERQEGNGNHGIGDENPAHTGCESSAPSTPKPEPLQTCPDGSAMKDTDGNGIVTSADCVTVSGGGPRPTQTCPDGSPMVDTDGNGIVNRADCSVVDSGGDDGEHPAGHTPGAEPEVVSTTATPPAPASPVLASAAAGVRGSSTDVMAPLVPARSGAQVLGVQIERSPSALATTGTSTLGLAPLAGALIALGVVLVVLARRPSAC